jgi:hypothetical protein
MNSYDQSTRSKYWRETTQSIFDSVGFKQQSNTLSGIILAVIFIVTMATLVVMRDSDSVFWVFVLGVVFASPFLRRYRVPRGTDANSAGQPFTAPAAAGQAISPEAERLLAALEQLEKRLANLETIVTQKEFDWERRLNQDPPPSAAPCPAPGAPGGGSPIA